MNIRRTTGRCIRLTCTAACIIFLVNPGTAAAYGGYGYYYGHRQPGHHSGFYAHYGQHGHASAAGYVILGMLGVILLSDILDNDRYDRQARVPRRDRLPEYRRTTSRPAPYPRVTSGIKNKAVYTYGNNEGWKHLKNGNAGQAMQIFAIQSQQNLNTGVPRVGFALAAAANGELDRGIWSMRRAVKMDPGSLDQIAIDDQLEPLIKEINEKYKSGVINNPEPTHASFMIAALSYLQQDYSTAQNYIVDADQSPSTRNLRQLLATSKD